MTNTRKTATVRPKAPGLTFPQMAARMKRPQRPAELVMDTPAAAEIEALTELLERAKRHDEFAAEGSAPSAPDVARELQRAEERADASRVRFTLEAISHRAYQALRLEHPPTREQLDQAKAAGLREEPAFDADTFAPALVHAQMIEPAPPEDFKEFEVWWDGLSDGQINKFWATAVGVQMNDVALGARNASAAEVLRTLGFPTG